MSDRMPTATEMIGAGFLDSDLAALLWLLSEGGVPIVVATSQGAARAEGLRSALAGLAGGGRTTADGSLPGGVVYAQSLEDVLRLGGADVTDEVPDTARELGVVVILGQPEPSEPARVMRAHYVRPIERDAAGHVQRRPPTLLSAWSDDMSRLDHFFWAITDELATRVGSEVDEFDRVYRRRRRLLTDLVAAGVFDATDMRRHIQAAALVEAGKTSPVDAPN